MTNERDKSAPLVDETVSRTYREIADERTPEHLDRAILAEAARAARPPYARSRAWTRPLAWAATIVLSVAIVLELTQVPAIDDAALELAMPTTDATDDAALELAIPTTDAADAPAAAVVTPAEEEPPTSVAAGRSNDFVPKTPEKTSMMQKTSAPLASGADAEGQRREAAVPAPTPAPATSTVEADDFEIKDKELLERADEMVETRYLNARQEAVSAEQAARVQGLALGSAAQTCPATVRQDPEDWLDCIEELDEAGFEAEADEQRRLLQEAFPAFDLP